MSIVDIYRQAPVIPKQLPPIRLIKNENASDKCNLIIPFTHNIDKPIKKYYFAIKITGVTGNDMVRRWYLSASPSSDNEIHLNNIILDPQAFSLKEKTYYKIQIAYCYTNNVTYYPNCYWSTTGIAKCININDFSCDIENLSIDKSNGQIRSFIGRYISQDRAEIVSSYRFDIYEGAAADVTAQTDEDRILFYSTGNLIHSDYDTIRIDPEKYQSGAQVGTEDITPQVICRDIFNLEKLLQFNKDYCIQYTVETVNNFTISSIFYNLKDNNLVRPEIQAFLVPTINYEEGYVSVQLVSNAYLEEAEPVAISGDFSLLKASAKENYANWVELLTFSLENQIPDLEIYKDFFVEQGEKYKYAVQIKGNKKISDNIYTLPSARLMSSEVQADFEDAFLLDAQRQLKIRYNPKITNFKPNRLEGKTDTIGSRFPFLSKNGFTDYKTFTISGLLSVLSDDQHLFRTQNQEYNELDNFEFNALTALSTNNFKTERDFKIEVMNWLANGKPKVFKSPGEGNYIIQLQGTNLTPNDTVGRMLHTFSSSAIEIDEYTEKKLQFYEFYEVKHIDLSKEVLEQYKLSTFLPRTELDIKLNKYYAEIEEDGKHNLYYYLTCSNRNIKQITFKNFPVNCKINLFKKISSSVNGVNDYYYRNKSTNYIFTKDSSPNFSSERNYYIKIGQTYYIGQKNFLIINEETNLLFDEMEISNIKTIEQMLYSKIILEHKPEHKKNYTDLINIDTSLITFNEIYGGNKLYLIGKHFFSNDLNAAGILENRPTSKTGDYYKVKSVMRIEKMAIRFKNFYKNPHGNYCYDADHNKFYQSYTYEAENFVFHNELDMNTILPQYCYYVIDPKKPDGQDDWILTKNNNNEIDYFPLSKLNRSIRINNNIINLTNQNLKDNYNIIEFNNLDNLSVLELGNGLIADICYYECIGDYKNLE